MARLSSLKYRHRFTEVRDFVVFVGCPRSGHSLLGSLLDAHPDAVVAHELDALKFVQAGWTRDELYDRILRQDREFTADGREWFGYDYNVPGQWQGRFRSLQVIGDKRGAVTTERLGMDPDLLPRLETLVGVPVRLIHVVRNPFDNIATMARRSGRSLEEATDRYFSICSIVGQIRSKRPTSVMDIQHEELVADPTRQLSSVCESLELEVTADYLSACTAVLFDSPRRTRDDQAWPPALSDRIRKEIDTYDFLPYETSA